MNKSNIVTNNNSSSFALPENKIDSQKILAEIDGEEQYGDGTIDYLLEAQLPKKTVSLTSINLSQKEEDLRSAINDFNENSEAKKLIIPIRTEDGRFTALSLTKESNGTPASATYIDLRGTEQEASPSFLQSGMNWMFGGAKDAAPKTTEIGSLPIHIRNILTTRSKIFPKDITFTTNKIQQPTDNIGEPFLVQILKSLADGKMNVINKSLHEGEQDFGNFSPELSRKADKMSRLEDAKKLVADYPELSSRRLEEKSSEITRGNPQGASTQSIAKFLAAMALITPATSQSTNLRGLGSQSNGDSLSLMDNDFHLEGAPKYPTLRPTSIPNPAFAPTPIPTPSSTTQTPSSKPTATPTTAPTGEPTKKPSTAPTTEPTEGPTTAPSNNPSGEPTLQPSSPPSTATNSPSTQTPSLSPTSEPTITATTKSSRPTSEPTIQKTIQPTAGNSSQPTINPSGDPTSKPSSPPSANPTSKTTISPSTQTPSLSPTSKPTITATTKSSSPTSEPTIQKTIQPTAGNSSQPTINPSELPTSQPSNNPSELTSSQPSSPPSTATISPSTQVPSSQTNPLTSLPTGEPSQTAAPSIASTAASTVVTTTLDLNQTFTRNQTSAATTFAQSGSSVMSTIVPTAGGVGGGILTAGIGAGIESYSPQIGAKILRSEFGNTLHGVLAAAVVGGVVGAIMDYNNKPVGELSEGYRRLGEEEKAKEKSPYWIASDITAAVINDMVATGLRYTVRHGLTPESNISSFLALLICKDAIFEGFSTDNEIEQQIKQINVYLYHINDREIDTPDTNLFKKAIINSLKEIYPSFCQYSTLFEASDLNGLRNNLKSILNANSTNIKNPDEEFLKIVMLSDEEEPNHATQQLSAPRPSWLSDDSTEDESTDKKIASLSSSINLHLSESSKKIQLGQSLFEKLSPERKLIIASDKLCNTTYGNHATQLMSKYNNMYNRLSATLGSSRTNSGSYHAFVDGNPDPEHDHTSSAARSDQETRAPVATPSVTLAPGSVNSLNKFRDSQRL